MQFTQMRFSALLQNISGRLAGMNSSDLSTKLRGLATSLSSEFYLEISSHFAVLWTVSRRKTGVRITCSERTKFEPDALRHVLSDTGYLWQPVTVVLHPPDICTKIYTIGEEEPREWLGANLPELFPPGNRNEMSMVFAVLRRKELLISFVNRNTLVRIRRRISEAGCAIKSIIPATSLDILSIDNDDADRERIRYHSKWALSNYDYQRHNGELRIWPSPGSPSPNRNALLLKACSDQNLDYCDDLEQYPLCFVPDSDLHKKNLKPLSLSADFRGQLQLPKTTSSRLPMLTLKYTAATTLVMLALVLFTGFVAIGKHLVAGKDTLELMSLRNELSTAENENQELHKRYSGLLLQDANLRVGGRFLDGLGHAIPPNSWLEKLEISRESDGAVYRFILSGFSFSEPELGTITDTLDNMSIVSEANLTGAKKVAGIKDSRLNSESRRRLVQFDIRGSINGEL